MKIEFDVLHAISKRDTCQHILKAAASCLTQLLVLFWRINHPKYTRPNWQSRQNSFFYPIFKHDWAKCSTCFCPSGRLLTCRNRKPKLTHISISGTSYVRGESTQNPPSLKPCVSLRIVYFFQYYKTLGYASTPKNLTWGYRHGMNKNNIWKSADIRTASLNAGQAASKQLILFSNSYLSDGWLPQPDPSLNTAHFEWDAECMSLQVWVGGLKNLHQPKNLDPLNSWEIII